VRWGLGIVALLAALLFGVSVWWEAYVLSAPISIFGRGGSGLGCGVMRGIVYVGGWWDSGPPTWDPECSIESAEGEEFHWWFDWQVEWGASGVLIVGAPLWLLLVGPGLGWVGLRWWGRGAPAWACARCGYDLRGIKGGVCPECGKQGTGARPQGEPIEGG
jgi:hypothetical protein